MLMLWAEPNSSYTAVSVKTVRSLTSRSCVRSKTCMPWPAFSDTMYAWSAYTLMSRQKSPPAVVRVGSRPRTSGRLGSLMSTNAVPSIPPIMAYSSPVAESVHPQMSLPKLRPSSLSGTLLIMSTPSHGYIPADFPRTQGAKLFGALLFAFAFAARTSSYCSAFES